MMRQLRFFMLVVVVAACATGGGDPAAVVADYLQAKVASDRESLARLLCTEMEGALEQEVASFANVEAVLENPVCELAGENQVHCEGDIVVTYGTEDRALPLQRYRVVQEDGEWRWCGVLTE